MSHNKETLREVKEAAEAITLRRIAEGLEKAKKDGFRYGHMYDPSDKVAAPAPAEAAAPAAPFVVKAVAPKKVK